MFRWLPTFGKYGYVTIFPGLPYQGNLIHGGGGGGEGDRWSKYGGKRLPSKLMRVLLTGIHIDDCVSKQFSSNADQ